MMPSSAVSGSLFADEGDSFLAGGPERPEPLNLVVGLKCVFLDSDIATSAIHLKEHGEGWRCAQLFRLADLSPCDWIILLWPSALEMV